MQAKRSIPCRRIVPAALACLAFAVLVPGAEAQWTQWGGPSRDFRIQQAELGNGWLKSGPKQVWQRDLGDGESAILVDGGALFTTYRDGESEVVVALDPDTGKTLWEHRYEAPIPEKMYVEHGKGPHATPVVARDSVCALGIAGRLTCLKQQDGTKIWSHDLIREYGGKAPDCGYGGSPLVYRNTLIVQVGGTGRGVVAFRLADGTVAWESQDFAAGYAAPTLIDVDGEEQLVAFMREQVVGLDPTDGALRWSHWHKTEYGVNASTPVWGTDGILFISSAYDNGSRGLRLSRAEGATRVEELWHQRKFQLHFSNAVRVGDVVYGTSGDFGPVFLTAVEVGSGRILWQERDLVSKASILDLGDGRLLMMDEKGKLVLASVSPDGVTVHAKHSLVDGRVWAPPTLVGRRLYVRDRMRAYAFDLG